MRISKPVAALWAIVGLWVMLGCASPTEMPSYVRPSSTSTPPVSVPPSVTDFAPTVLPVNWIEEKVSSPVLGEVKFSEESGGSIKSARITIWETEQRANAQALKDSDENEFPGILFNDGYIRCGPVVFAVGATISEQDPENERAEARKYAVDSMAAAAPGMAALGACETSPVR